jgi:cytochrome o ubiquinol oxidase subunit 3
MTTNTMNADHHDVEVHDKVVFGFWLYILSDCILFSMLFATYVVLHNSTYGGVGSHEIFTNMPYVLLETFVLLSSSFTYGVALLSIHRKLINRTLLFLLITFILGAIFVGMELNEFHHLVMEGHGPTHSAFLSAFFTLLGTHGLHVTCGLVWMIILMLQTKIHGANNVVIRKLSCLGLFWHFLDIVWIFIFTIVYLMGVM